MSDDEVVSYPFRMRQRTKERFQHLVLEAKQASIGTTESKITNEDVLILVMDFVAQSGGIASIIKSEALVTSQIRN